MVYTKEFLILELQRFELENGRKPVAVDMQIEFGYPTSGAYKSHFVTWNNALMAAGLEINVYQNHWQDGTETCDNCGKLKPENQNWYYENKQRLCLICNQNLNNHKNGKLDPGSNTGFAFASQRTVAKTLGLDLKYDCNCSEGFGSEYDLYDKKYKYINVKAAMLNNVNSWQFGLSNKYTPDTYILLALSKDKSDILHVWVTEPEDDLTFDEKNFKFKSSISITNSERGLKRAKGWEVDCEPYNVAYHSMSLKNCSVLRSD